MSKTKTFLAAAIASMAVFSASLSEAALPPIVVTENVEINVSIRDDISKIKWDNQYITFVQFDEEKIAAFKEAYGDIDVQQIANRGISGDFLTVSAQRHGKINTDYGAYEIIWTNIPSRGYGAVVSNGNEYKELQLIDLDEKKSLIYGNFSNFIGVGANDDKPMALALVKKMNVFEGRPMIITENRAISLSNYNIEWEHEWTQEQEDIKKIRGHLTDAANTEIDIYATSAGARYLSLADGTRVFTKMTSNPEIDLLFYVDFDNEKDSQTATFVTLGAIPSRTFGAGAEYDNTFSNPNAIKIKG